MRNAVSVGDVLLSRYMGKQPRYLPVVLMFLTNRCNLRCRMCGLYDAAEETRRAESELSTDDWKGVIDSAVRLHAAMVSMSGGEPLVRRDFFELIAYARARNLAVHICTNGTMMNEERARALGEAGVNAVSVSLDSPDPDEHDALRGAGNHDKAVKAVRLLRAHAPDAQVGINYLMTAQNFRNMTRMPAFAESVGAQQLKLAPIHTNLLHSAKPEEDFGPLLFTSEQIDELEAEIERLIPVLKKSPLLTTSAAFLRGIPGFYRAPKRFRCFAGYGVCAVDPQGNVAPCCDMRGPFSVREKPLHEIWRSPEFREMRRGVRSCEKPCWDTTNTELSLRLRPGALAAEALRTWRDLGFYYGDET